jgi:predicted metalloprotease with PDZ domain
MFLFAISSLANASAIIYSVSFPQPQSHYVVVDALVKDWKGGSIDFYMPVWTPGSYLVREFARNVEQVSVTSAGRSLNCSKSSKNHWSVKDAPKGDIHIHYLVYAFELSVRTSFVDADHANLNGSSVFITVKGMEAQPLVVDLHPDPSWKVLSVPLDAVSDSPWKVKAGNYDELIDAPFEIGNHKVIAFTAAGVKHEIAMVGAVSLDENRFTKDLTRMVEEEVKIYGSHPCKRYIFFVQNLGVGNGGGGLEHKNSCTVQTSRWSYATESGYNGFLGLMAHEYFHLWNVKRLRPAGLGPFNYDEEVYTDLLYVAEGFTAYYEDLISRRSGFLSEAQYLGELAGRMNYVDNTPGNKIQSTAESGTDAWIKYYRTNENSNNATISYYTKEWSRFAHALHVHEVCSATGSRLYIA